MPACLRVPCNRVPAVEALCTPRSTKARVTIVSLIKMGCWCDTDKMQNIVAALSTATTKAVKNGRENDCSSYIFSSTRAPFPLSALLRQASGLGCAALLPSSRHHTQLCLIVYLVRCICSKKTTGARPEDAMQTMEANNF